MLVYELIGSGFQSRFCHLSDNRARNHMFLFVQAQEIGVLLVVISNKDISSWNANHLVHLVSYLQPIAITSILY